MKDFLVAILISLIFMFGVLVGIHMRAIKDSGLKVEAIELGYAQHNAKTGDWEWIKPESGAKEN